MNSLESQLENQYLSGKTGSLIKNNKFKARNLDDQTGRIFLSSRSSKNGN